MGILAKILEGQKKAGLIKKNGYDAKNDYHYYKAEDILNGVREHLNQLGVVTRHEILEWKVDNFYDPQGRGRPRHDIKGRVIFTDVETGEEYAHDVVATGSDVGSDKGPRKAATQLKKIAFLDVFLISENAEAYDTDGQAEQEPVNNSPQAQPSQRAELKDLVTQINSMINDSSPIDGSVVGAVLLRQSDAILGADKIPDGESEIAQKKREEKKRSDGRKNVQVLEAVIKDLKAGLVE